jgi:hypothetical protein
MMIEQPRPDCAIAPCAIVAAEAAPATFRNSLRFIQLRCGQVFELMHSSAIRSRSTGRPPTRCSVTISAASSGLHVSVPHGLWIHHHRRPVLALVQAAGFVDPHLAAQPGLARQLLQPRVQFACSIACARGPRRVSGADVVADKDVAFKYGQAAILLNSFQSNNFAPVPVSPPDLANLSHRVQPKKFS